MSHIGWTIVEESPTGSLLLRSPTGEVRRVCNGGNPRLEAEHAAMCERLMRHGAAYRVKGRLYWSSTGEPIARDQ